MAQKKPKTDMDALMAQVCGFIPPADQPAPTQESKKPEVKVTPEELFQQEQAAHIPPVKQAVPTPGHPAPETPPAAQIPTAEEPPVPPAAPPAPNPGREDETPPAAKVPLIKRCYYLPEDVLDALRLKEFRESRNGRGQQSSIVEAALRAFLQMELNELALAKDLKRLDIIKDKVG